MLSSPPTFWELMIILIAGAITFSCLIHLTLRRRDELLVDYFTPEDVSETDLESPPPEEKPVDEESEDEHPLPQDEWPDHPMVEEESQSH